MSYIMVHKRADGSVERKRVRVDGVSAKRASEIVEEAHNLRMKSLRDKHGWAKGKHSRLIASIPEAVVEEVMINDGPDAAKDMNYLIRRAEKLGFTVRTRRAKR